MTFDALDANGSTVIWANHQRIRTQVIPVMAPGASVAVGNSLALEERAGDQIVSMKVTMRTDQWLAAGTGTDGLGDVTTTLVAGSGKRLPDGNGSVAYTVESRACAAMVSRGVSMVFRSGSGQLIGGTLHNGPEPSACEPAKSDAISTNTGQPGVPADADLNRTMVTVYCDFDRPQRHPASAVPYN
ncbi:hypothetical protein AB0G04_03030 [Actinoplanes sp. NPDC023801]|uniref:hypothetical protein n=1 Tax=Actinoplanes sp. NPDC023801 TaxID=3154595 RepID=UPI0033C3C4D5